MRNSKSQNSEFGKPPEQYPVQREQNTALLSEDFGSPQEKPAQEHLKPGPELIEPGTFPWTKPDQKKKPFLARAAMLLAAIWLFLFAFPDLMITRGGPASKADAAQETAENTQEQQPAEASPQPEVTQAPVTAAPTAEPALTPTSAPTETPVPTPTETPAPTPTETPTPEPTPVPEPSCEIMAYSFSAQMRGTLFFKDMESVTGVTLEVRDTLLDLTVSETDITNDIPEDGVYIIEPFWTDTIYYDHRSEYDAANAFPEEVMYVVKIQYESEDGPAEKTYEKVTDPEIGWYTRYTSESEPKTDYNAPGYFEFGTYEIPAEPTIVFNDPEAVEPGVICVEAEIDGQKMDADAFETRVDTFDGSLGDGSTVTFYNVKVFLKRPEAYPENAGHTLVFTITQYMGYYDQVWSNREEIQF
ncbi:MAG: hypothetical protein E7240_05025 [Lachnospiraceae bacterium]|nr:hypothetical protein [Lachnospiraceae bacterium]